MHTIKDFKVGDKVRFGRRNGEKTLGEVVKVNRKNLKVRTAETRGTKRTYSKGSVWNVSPALCEKVEGDTSAAPAKPTYKVGQTVQFRGFSWAVRGEGTLTGVVTRNGPDAEVYAEGRFHFPKTMTVVGKRDLETVKKECLSVYAALSPENLSCDGELSRGQVRAKAARLNRALKALWKEAGREVYEPEAWETARAR